MINLNSLHVIKTKLISLIHRVEEVRKGIGIVSRLKLKSNNIAVVGGNRYLIESCHFVSKWQLFDNKKVFLFDDRFWKEYSSKCGIKIKFDKKMHFTIIDTQF
ncbi:hypothetical protein BFZC1_17044 [Lysinibacillus fusiformis ZC1]|nr:hypothetical protein BFZC1_17044 [Lysinibacillus fusiformis ZC1]